MNLPPIEKQLGFLLYVSSKELIKKYTPILKKYKLTYTGYIVVTAIGNDEITNIKTLGDRIYLDSGTLTPLLKKLAEKGYITRERSLDDERNLQVALTDEGKTVKEKMLADMSELKDKSYNQYYDEIAPLLESFIENELKD